MVARADPLMRPAQTELALYHPFMRFIHHCLSYMYLPACWDIA